MAWLTNFVLLAALAALASAAALWRAHTARKARALEERFDPRAAYRSYEASSLEIDFPEALRRDALRLESIDVLLTEPGVRMRMRFVGTLEPDEASERWARAVLERLIERNQAVAALLEIRARRSDLAPVARYLLAPSGTGWSGEALDRVTFAVSAPRGERKESGR